MDTEPSSRSDNDPQAVGSSGLTPDAETGLRPLREKYLPEIRLVHGQQEQRRWLDIVGRAIRQVCSLAGHLIPTSALPRDEQ